MSICVPKGFLLAGVHCRIKRDPQKPDLALVMSETPATGVGVYTQNLVFAAPVELDRSRTPSDQIRAVVICSGVANACTGQRGLDDARQMARLAAAVCGAKEEQVLVLSTGVIGAFLPMDKIEQGIAAAAVKLGDNEACLISAARGMLTTDTVHQAGRPQRDHRRPPDPGDGHGEGGGHDGPQHGHHAGPDHDRRPAGAGRGPGGAAGGHRREFQLHERRRPHEHQRHRAAGGQRRRRRRAAGRRRPGRASAARWTKSASTWPRRLPATAKGPRT